MCEIIQFIPNMSVGKYIPWTHEEKDKFDAGILTPKELDILEAAGLTTKDTGAELITDEELADYMSLFVVKIDSRGYVGTIAATDYITCKEDLVDLVEAQVSEHSANGDSVLGFTTEHECIDYYKQVANRFSRITIFV